MIRVGDVVKFTEALEDGDDALRFRVIELRGDRVLVEAIVDMRIRPTYVYPVATLVNAEL